MPRFSYKALRTDDKTPYTGTVEAANRFEVYALVRKEGGQILSVTEGRTGFNPLSFDLGKLFGRFREIDKIILIRNLGAMLAAGLPMSRALGVAERQARRARVKEVVHGIEQEIQKGGSLSSGMLKYPAVFPSLVTSMVAAGEESGTLSDTLHTIADQLERSYELKKKIKGAMIYPAVIVSVLMVVGVLMMIFIVPTLTATFKDMGVTLPLTTRVVISISDFLVAHTFTALLISVAVILAFVGTLHTRAGKRAFEAIILRIPVIGTLVKETNSARTGRTLASLLSAAVNALAAIEITRDVVQNSYYRAVLEKAREQVQQGKPLAQVFLDAEHLYPPLVGELIAVGEETGALPDMLRQVAQYYENEVEQKTKNMSTIVEPFLMLVVGGAVGFFAVSMISPIYSITSSIQ